LHGASRTCGATPASSTSSSSWSIERGIAAAIEIRRVRGGEWARLRALRLRALAEAPAAFASSVELEAAFPEVRWREMAIDAERAETAAMFIAAHGERWLGMSGARWFDRPGGVVSLWAMWVDPAARGRGVGQRLVGAVHDWAAGRGAQWIRLGVVKGAGDAQPFYERLGFALTGETRALPRDDALTALFLWRPV
jgi:GNAT superfamily N-acetyltransferase